MNLTGVWANESRSVMVLTENADHSLTGKYHSFVGRDPNTRNLSGQTNVPDGERQLLAFAVCFEFTDENHKKLHSASAWSGWAKDDRIETHWVLTTSPKSDDVEWSSHLIGEDTFMKISDLASDEIADDHEALKRLAEQARSQA